MTTKTPPISVVQLSDTHLFESTEGKLLGLNTQNSFDATLEHALKNIPKIDCFLLTGDVVQDGLAAGYQRITDRLSATGIPTYCLPGNHDESVLMKQYFNTDLVQYVSEFKMGMWQFFMLDSNIPNSACGRLKPDEMTFIQSQLDANAHTIVCTHHNPLHVGSKWLDTMAIDNPEILYNRIDSTQIKAVICGHVHQAQLLEQNGIPLYTAPSTCIQFKPQSVEFALDETPPGYRHLQLHDNGSIETTIHRLPTLPESIEFTNAGY